MRQVAGSSNEVADSLSRPAVGGSINVPSGSLPARRPAAEGGMSAIGSSAATNPLESAVGGIKALPGSLPAQRPTSGSEMAAIGHAAALVASRSLGAPLDL
jgi:hypothetical protein